MGADIHLITEVKENGVWKQNIDKIFKNPWYKEDEKNKTKDQQWKLALEEYISNPPDSRNYDWFAILANVRNGRGFAGVKTGQGFDVIAEPKGLPNDISDVALKYFCYEITDNDDLADHEIDGVYRVGRYCAAEWMLHYDCKISTIGDKDYVTNPDYHSSSYLTVEDFNNFDWNQVTMKNGIISLSQYKELRDTNKTPDTWSGGVGGGNTITMSDDEADEILDGNTEMLLTRDNKNMFRPDAEPETKPASEWDIYVQYQWSVLYSKWFEKNIQNTVDPLRKLKEKYEDVRIVFAFDN